MNSFEVNYGNDDGFVGGANYSFDISRKDLNEDESEESLRDMFWQMIEDHFDRHHRHLFCSQEEEFIAWAKEQNKSQDEED